MTLARTQIQRSIGKMVIDMHRLMDSRANEANDYGIAEREDQFQITVSGNAANTPVEQVVPVTFTNHYASDCGHQRDSSLEVPQLRTGWEFSVRPAGLVPYAHVQSWTYDDAEFISGCNITIGVFAPSFDSGQAFVGVLHASFQGWGAPFDNGTDIAPADGSNG